MTFKEQFDEYNNECEWEVVGKRTGQDAINDLMRSDQKELYRFESVYDGIFNFCSEDGLRLIAVRHSGYYTMNLFMTVPEILLNGNFNYIEIRVLRKEI